MLCYKSKLAKCTVLVLLKSLRETFCFKNTFHRWEHGGHHNHDWQWWFTMKNRKSDLFGQFIQIGAKPRTMSSLKVLKSFPKIDPKKCQFQKISAPDSFPLSSSKRSASERPHCYQLTLSASGTIDQRKSSFGEIHPLLSIFAIINITVTNRHLFHQIEPPEEKCQVFIHWDALIISAWYWC